MLATKICVIGYCKIPESKQNYVRRELEREVKAALEDGYKTFLMELAEGVGMIFAFCINSKREQYPEIYMEAVLSHPSDEPYNAAQKEILGMYEGLQTLHAEYQKDYPFGITRHLVDSCDRIVFVADGPDGKGDQDTAYAIEYANTMERDVRIIII